MPWAEFPRPAFPDYCSGVFYVLSGQVDYRNIDFKVVGFYTNINFKVVEFYTNIDFKVAEFWNTFEFLFKLIISDP